MNSADWESFDSNGDPVKGLAFALIFDGLLVIALLLILSLITCVAEAQEDEGLKLPTSEQLQARCAPGVEGEHRGGRTAVVVDGVTVANAAWFHPDVVRCMTARLRLLPEYAVLLAFAERRHEDAEAAMRGKDRLVHLAEEGERRAVGVLEASERRARLLEEELDAWYNNKTLWIGVGAVAVIALEVVSVWLYSELKDDEP